MVDTPEETIPSYARPRSARLSDVSKRPLGVGGTSVTALQSRLRVPQLPRPFESKVHPGFGLDPDRVEQQVNDAGSLRPARLVPDVVHSNLEPKSKQVACRPLYAVLRSETLCREGLLNAGAAAIVDAGIGNLDSQTNAGVLARDAHDANQVFACWVLDAEVPTVLRKYEQRPNEV